MGPEAEGVFTLFGIAFFLIGVALIGLGVVGEYVGRIYEQVRQRPRYTIAAVLGRATPQPAQLPSGAALGLPRAAAAGRRRGTRVSGPTAVVFAYHDVGVRCLKALLSGGVGIPLVVTVADDPQRDPLVRERRGRPRPTTDCRSIAPADAGGRAARAARSRRCGPTSSSPFITARC